MNKYAALTNLRRNIAGLQQIADDMQKSIDADECAKSWVDSHPENVPTLEEMRNTLRKSFGLTDAVPAPKKIQIAIYGQSNGPVL